jgi:hypothetical protein
MSTTDALRNDIYRLLEASNTREIMRQNWTSLISQMMAVDPSIPSEFWDILKSNFDIDEMIELMVSVYARYYTEDDVVELIKFNESPTGKKMVVVAPLVQQESAILIQQLAQQKMQKSFGLPYGFPY